jgi:hypothetical protein
MPRKWLSVLLAAALPLAGCTVDGIGNIKFTDSKLRGVWKSTDTSLYSGGLVTGFDTMTITGCGASQTPPAWNGGDDAKRAFRNLARNGIFASRLAEEKRPSNGEEMRDGERNHRSLPHKNTVSQGLT